MFVAGVDARELAGDVFAMDRGGLEESHVEFLLLNLRPGWATCTGQKARGSDTSGEQGAANRGQEKIETA
jgi:hypothetical protein